MNKYSKLTSMAVVIGAILIQLVPVDRSNPPVQAELQTTPEVHAILVRACYDCHSNQTSWPWYSRIAPASWLVANDVRKGREALNFSGGATEEQAEMLQEIPDEVAEGEMPPWYYLIAHPEARLTARDRSILDAWAGTAGLESSREE